MNQIAAFIAGIEWNMIIILCLTIGLAPFTPPHIVEKISMLVHGTLKKPLDWFDLFLHGMPWLILIIKVIITIRIR